MATVSLGRIRPIIIGAPDRDGFVSLSSTNNGVALMDAANEAFIMGGNLLWTDGGTHTVDTTGSSSLGWLTGNTVTFANAGTTLVIGLGSVDTSNGPPARAANVANVITFDVSATLTGGATLSANTWQENTPGAGTKTIAHGDLIAFSLQMTARAGADAVTTAALTIPQGRQNLSFATGYAGGTYSDALAAPNCVVRASDGTYGYFLGGNVQNNAIGTQTWNNTSTTKEYGNYFLLPIPISIRGLVSYITLSGNTDAVLYTDPLGTPVAQQTASANAHVAQSAAINGVYYFLFSSRYDLPANTPCAGIIKPSTSTNVGLPYISFANASHQDSYQLGQNCYAINRNTGAFAAQNSNKDRFGIGLLVTGADDGLTPTGRLTGIQRGAPY